MREAVDVLVSGGGVAGLAAAAAFGALGLRCSASIRSRR
jgi:2-polyprenyl-6-methoxyphenol hydroxylase-like FAD-dependent oxidoreductase